MVGIIVVAHGDLAGELLKSAALFCEKVSFVETISFLPTDSIDQLYTSLKAAVNIVDRGAGVVVLTDLEGGSPSNEASRLVMEGWPVEVVAGVNMPMLLTVLFDRDNLSRYQLAEQAVVLGRKGIASLGEKVLQRLHRQAQQPDDMDETL